MEFREVPRSEIESHVRPKMMSDPLSRDAQMAAAMLSGRIKAWLCMDGSQAVGNCVADSATGEVLSIGVNASHEGAGIGRRLLSLAVGWLRSTGAQRIWVAAPSDTTLRAYGFYRALGWRPSGERTTTGDEILELPADSA